MYIFVYTCVYIYNKSPIYKWVPFQEHIHKSSLFISPTKLAKVPTKTISYTVLYCNSFIILFTQVIINKKHKRLRKHLILWYSTLKSTVVQYNSWHTEAGIEWTGKKSYWLEEGEEGRDGRAEGSSAIGDRGQVHLMLMAQVLASFFFLILFYF